MKLVRNTYNSFNIFMLMLNVNKVCQVRVIREKHMFLPKYGDLILNSIALAREKRKSLVLCRPDFWMVWRCHDIPFAHFCFLFISKTILVWEWYPPRLWWFFQKHHSESYLVITSYVQSSFSSFTRQIDNSILGDILQLNILQT